MNRNRKRIRLLLSYDGSLFKGWQKQKTTSQTVQSHLEKALSKIFNQRVAVVGSGRTDAGVHALAQTAHFDLSSSKKIPSHLVRSINALTPSEISCHQAWLTPIEFHAQMSATKRTYRYVILHTKTPSAFKGKQSWWYPYSIHFQNLQKMATQIIGKKNFKSFQNKGTTVRTTERNVFQAQWFWLGSQRLVFEISANSFLKQMVRNLVGTQLYLMSQTDPCDQLCTIFLKENRKMAFQTAPAQGLFLYSVSYPLTLDKKCKKI